jgi:hypothetical protein
LIGQCARRNARGNAYGSLGGTWVQLRDLVG